MNPLLVFAYDAWIDVDLEFFVSVLKKFLGFQTFSLIKLFKSFKIYIDSSLIWCFWKKEEESKVLNVLPLDLIGELADFFRKLVACFCFRWFWLESENKSVSWWFDLLLLHRRFNFCFFSSSSSSSSSLCDRAWVLHPWWGIRTWIAERNGSVMKIQ